MRRLGGDIDVDRREVVPEVAGPVQHPRQRLLADRCPGEARAGHDPVYRGQRLSRLLGGAVGDPDIEVADDLGQQLPRDRRVGEAHAEEDAGTGGAVGAQARHRAVRELPERPRARGVVRACPGLPGQAIAVGVHGELLVEPVEGDPAPGGLGETLRRVNDGLVVDVVRAPGPRVGAEGVVRPRAFGGDCDVTAAVQDRDVIRADWVAAGDGPVTQARQDRGGSRHGDSWCRGPAARLSRGGKG